MSRVLTNEQNYYDIADTIRQMKEVNTTYKPREMASALKDIYSNEVEGTLPLTFESNGMPLINYRIDGASGGVGDLITDISDENYNKYKVSVVIIGKNIYNIATYPLTTRIGIYGNSGKTVANGSFASTLDYVPIKKYANHPIVLNKRPGGYNTGIAYYDENYDYISGTTNNNQPAGNPINSTIPTNAFYMRFTVPVNSKEIQIELGENSSSYEPYHELTTNIYLDEPIEENESISLSDTEIDIPTIEGTNTLTIDTTVQPSNVYIQAPKDSLEATQIASELEEI